MIHNTDVFISQLPLDCSHEIEASALDFLTFKCGIDPEKVKNPNIGWFDVREFPGGVEIFSDTMLDNPQTIVTVEGLYKRQFGRFLSSPLKRDQIGRAYCSKRFGGFPTPIMDVAVSEHLTVYGLELIEGLILGEFNDPIENEIKELTDLDVFRFLGRNTDRMSEKHVETIRDWILKSRKTSLNDFYKWCHEYRIATGFRDDLNHQIERILQNDLL